MASKNAFVTNMRNSRVTFREFADTVRMEPAEMSFQDLYEKYAEDVYRFSYWLCGNADEAKDITSETFLRVWTAKAETRLETVKAYLLAIARNVYLHEKRKKDRHSSIDENVPAGTLQPDQSAEINSDLAVVLRILQTLPEIDRSVFIMAVEDGLPYGEIARLTGLTLSAVKVKVFRTRLKLTSSFKTSVGVSP